MWFRKAPAFDIRPLRASDLGACAAIHREAFRRGWDESEFRGLLGDASTLADGLYDAKTGELRGFVVSRRALEEAEVLSIAIARKARGAGAGRALLDHHLARLGGAGVKALYLEVDANNAAALALYRRAGFTKVGERKAYYQSASGPPAAALILRRDGP